MSYQTLIDILENNRSVDRAVCYVDGENSERRVPYADFYKRALGILYHLQAMGAVRGDKMIIFLSNNEQFIDGFWAAVAGGIVPVPLAVGISDEHRHKLLRVARKLGDPFLYTDTKSLERLESLAMERKLPDDLVDSVRAQHRDRLKRVAHRSDGDASHTKRIAHLDDIEVELIAAEHRFGDFFPIRLTHLRSLTILLAQRRVIDDE